MGGDAPLLRDSLVGVPPQGFHGVSDGSLLQRCTSKREGENLCGHVHPVPGSLRFAIPDRAPSRSDPDRATLQPVAVALVPAKERALPDAGRGSLLLRRLRASAPATGLLAGRLLQRLEQKTSARWPLDLVMYGATSSDRAFCGTHISKSTGRDIFN